MRSEISILSIFILVIAGCIVGCTEKNEDNDDPIEDSKTIGASGGDLTVLDGKVTLSFPDGALDADKGKLL